MAKYAKPKKKTTSSKRSLTPWIIGAGVLFILLIVLAVFLNERSATATIEPPTVEEEWVNRSQLGNPEAVVTVQAWEDFLCPACGEWARTIEPRLVAEYVETGDVILEFKQFPLQMHAPGAIMGAQASECAADQGAFWPYHDRLFAEAASRGQAGFQLERLIDYAGDLDLDEGEFRTCMTSQKYRSAVDASVSEAVSLGLNSTPSVLVNGQSMEPYDYDALKAEIDRLLAESGS
jgi:protein-disulfide isomerase